MLRSRLSYVPAAGLIATGLGLALLGNTPESPLASSLLGASGSWGPLEEVGNHLGVNRLSDGTMLTLSVVMLFSAGCFFMYAAFLVWRGLISLRRVVVVSLVLHAMTVFLPILFSQDVFSYVTYGRIVSEHGGNPYVDVPKDFPEDPLASVVGYGDTRTVYGPVFTSLSAGITSVAPNTSVAVQAFARISMVASVMTMFLAVAAARVVAPSRMAFAGLVIGWNPVILFHTVGGAHNDTLVGLCLAASILFVLKNRTLLAVVVLVLATLIKAIAVLPLVILFGYVIANSRVGERIKCFLRHAGVGALVALPFVIPFFQLSNPTMGALPGAGRLASGSGAVGSVMQALGLDDLSEIAGSAAQALAPLLTVLATIGIVYLFLRGPQVPVVGTLVASMGWVSLLAVLSIDQHWPWYAAWTLPMAWALPARGRVAMIVTSLGLTVLHPWLGLDGSHVDVTFYAGLTIIGAMLVWVVVLIFGIIRRGVSEGRDALLDPALGDARSL